MSGTVMTLPVMCLGGGSPVLTLEPCPAAGGGAAPANLSKVQVTPQALSSSSPTVAMTFAVPPTVGNGIVVPVILYGNAASNYSCADNRGNTYLPAKLQAASSWGVADVFYCPKVVTGGGPFIVTVTGENFRSRCGVAIEVGGVGAGLVIDQAVGNNITGSPITLTTPTLTGEQAFLVAALAAGTGAYGAPTVGVLTPPWVQETEYLGAPYGEIDSRVLPTVAGAASVSWTWGPILAASVLVAFKAS